MKSKRGFTLIELIVVIAIMTILAAVALPRFIDAASQARIAAVNAVAGGLRSAVALAVAEYTITGNTAAGSVSFNGVSVACNVGTGIPLGSYPGIGTAMGFNSLTDSNGLTVNYTTPTNVTFQPNGGGINCQTMYDGITGIVTIVTTGC